MRGARLYPVYFLIWLFLGAGRGLGFVTDFLVAFLTAILVIPPIPSEIVLGVLSPNNVRAAVLSFSIFLLTLFPLGFGGSIFTVTFWRSGRTCWL